MAESQDGHALVRAFPPVGPLMWEAYEDLRHVEQSNDLALTHHLGSVDDLPRPWLPATCASVDLREEVWEWLDAVVDWLNTEFVWLGEDEIPACWPLHPHLVHELGVIADQRRRATLTLTSDLLEEWHRYCLPAFFDRLRTRTRGSCETGHTGPPAAARTTRYRSASEHARRAGWYRADLLAATKRTGRQPSVPRLVVSDGLVIDPRTGEIS
ncbi:hypothetical protein [uncultured Friedmanniella sp.]|uniref:hypothetical protein n=1 Tax=uncultured Friedmanniella sp. TaxID=335381 RepID=UPI0035C9D336